MDAGTQRLRRAGARTVAGLLSACVALAGCGVTDGSATEGEDGGSGSGELVVFAAASLSDAFAEVADAYAAAHAGTRVVVNTAGSQILAHQVTQGAPADVFASADPAQMAVVDEAGYVDGTPLVFASNRLAIAVEPGNPRGIGGLGDLDDPGLVVVLPAEQVPAGAYAREALAAAGVALQPTSQEPDVRATLSKVALGEADAAIVYASDVAVAAGRVDGVAIPTAANVTATYPIAALTSAADPTAAGAFVDFVLADAGQAILARHGLQPP